MPPSNVSDHEAPPIPGTLVSRERSQVIKSRLARLLGTNKAFPGSQPVSFAHKHLQTLKEKDYYVCEKSDGIRFLMYMTKDPSRPDRPTVYLIDRHPNYYHISNLIYPIPTDVSGKAMHTETVLDGELILERFPDGKKQLKFLVFDCLACDGKLYMNRPLDKRIGVFMVNIIIPLRQFMEKFPKSVSTFPFITEGKKMERSYGIEMLFRDIIPSLHHGNDGLIFTCVETPYITGTDHNLLKWKPKTINTLDFMLGLEFTEADEQGNVNFDSMPQFHLGVYHGRNSYSHFADMYVDEEEWEKLKSFNTPLQDRVIECSLDEENQWRFLRFRDDKSEANHISTVESVLKSIEDAVSEEDLLHEAYAIKHAYNQRHPKPPSNEKKRKAQEEPVQNEKVKSERKETVSDA
ncbi:mRNA guanylyltransferase Ceg1 [Schizosaccharomyces osmophilus]|uniref:mRNA-capping enzyme subunit alpha n=1 Tax=Schizosaccharomyces osmophilus TaxID=2545709 RepID=A0AAE9WET3_9SCHI|nr:mRNA guanylyltransferase Ceg1 [Schizosaccharomyces osmophilus]WBW74530.1 mRNA guanylyltransferase Ceg1 [Schizosaccharomyces osmophilus]